MNSRKLTPDEVRMYLFQSLAADTDRWQRRLRPVIERLSGLPCTFQQAKEIWDAAAGQVDALPPKTDLNDAELARMLSPFLTRLPAPPDDPELCRRDAALWARLQTVLRDVAGVPAVRRSPVVGCFLNMAERVGETEAEALVRSVAELARILERQFEIISRVVETRQVFITVPVPTPLGLGAETGPELGDQSGAQRQTGSQVAA